MSYVLQNFLTLQRHIVFTPRLKKLIFLNNFKFFLFLFKSTNTIWINKNKEIFFSYPIFYYTIYFNFFFFNFWRVIFKSYHNNYTNNLFTSFEYTLINSLHHALDNKNNPLISIPCQSTWLFNSYFTSIKILNYKIKKTFFDNNFFFLFNLYPQHWYSFSIRFKFFSSFIFSHNTQRLFYFYNNYFLNVYNY